MFPFHEFEYLGNDCYVLLDDQTTVFCLEANLNMFRLMPLLLIT